MCISPGFTKQASRNKLHETRVHETRVHETRVHETKLRVQERARCVLAGSPGAPSVGVLGLSGDLKTRLPPPAQPADVGIAPKPKRRRNPGGALRQIAASCCRATRHRCS